MTDNSTPSEMRDFISQLVDQMPNAQLNDAEREQLINDLSGELDNYMMAAAIEALPDNQLDRYQELVNQSVSPDELRAFFEEQVTDLDQVLSNAVAEFRQLYIVE